jgi:hypothetical protein
MSVTLQVRHNVEDVDAWKPGFDGHEDSRRLHGATAHRVLRDGNALTILIDFPDAGSAEAIVSDPALREVMAKAGVIGQPDVAILTPVEEIRY